MENKSIHFSSSKYFVPTLMYMHRVFTRFYWFNFERQNIFTKISMKRCMHTKKVLKEAFKRETRKGRTPSHSHCITNFLSFLFLGNPNFIWIHRPNTHWLFSIRYFMINAFLLGRLTFAHIFCLYEALAANQSFRLFFDLYFECNLFMFSAELDDVDLNKFYVIHLKVHISTSNKNNKYVSNFTDYFSDELEICISYFFGFFF